MGGFLAEPGRLESELAGKSEWRRGSQAIALRKSEWAPADGPSGYAAQLWVMAADLTRARWCRLTCVDVHRHAVDLTTSDELRLCVCVCVCV